MACATSTGISNILQWTEPDDVSIWQYHIYRRTDDVTASLTTADVIAKVPFGTTKYVDILTSQTTHWYWIRSFSWSWNDSTYTDTITPQITLVPYQEDSNEPSGFPNTTDSVLSWDDGTRTLSISPSGTSFSYYIKGEKFTKTAADTIVPTNTTGQTWFYYDSATLTEINNPTYDQQEDLILEYALVAMLYWNTAQATKVLFGDERHGMTMDGATHHYLHDTVGLAYGDGLGLVNFTADQTGADDVDAQFGHTSGKVYDEDLEHTAAAVASTTGLPILYRNGSGGPWVSTTNAGFSVITAAAGTRLVYNQDVAGTWQLTEVNNQQFVLCHVFASNQNDYPLVALVGQTQYATLAAAQTGATTEINSIVTGDLPDPELRPIGTVIFQTSNVYGNQVNARVRAVAGGGDYIDWRSQELTGAGVTPSDHGSLSGLADDDHTQYVINDGSRGNQSICAGLTVGGNVIVCGTLTVSSGATFGSTLSVSGAFTVNDTATVSYLTVTANASVGGTLHVSGVATFGGTLTVSGITTINNDLTASNINATAALSVQTTLHVSGASTFGSTVTVSGAFTVNDTATVSYLTVTANASVGGTLHVSGAVTFGSSLAVSGTSTFGGTVTNCGDVTICGTLTIQGTAIHNATGINVVFNQSAIVSTDVDFSTASFSVASGTGTCAIVSLLDDLVLNSLSLSGTLSVSGATTLGSTLSVSGQATFSDNVIISGTLTVSGTSTLDGAVTINDALTVSGTTTLQGSVTISGGLTVNTLTVTGDLTMCGTLTVNGTAFTGSSALNVEFNQSQISTTVLVFNTSSFTVTTASGTCATVTILDNLSLNSLSLSGTLSVSGAVTFGDTLSVSGQATFSNNVRISGNLSVSGTSSFDGNVKINAQLDVSAQSSFGIVSISGALTIDAATTLNSSLIVSGITTLQGATTISGGLTVNTLAVTGNATICGTLTVDGNTTIDANLVVSGTSTLQGAVTISGGLTVNSLTVTGDLTMCGTLTVNGTAITNASGNIIYIEEGAVNRIDTDGQDAYLNFDGSDFDVTVGTGESATVTLASALVLDGGLTINGGATISGGLTVSGTTSLNGGLNVSGSTTLGNTTICGTLTVSGVATFDNNVSITGNVTIDGNAIIYGTTTINDNLNVSGAVTVCGGLTTNTLVVTSTATVYGNLSVNADVIISSQIAVGNLASILTNNCMYVYEQNTTLTNHYGIFCIAQHAPTATPTVTTRKIGIGGFSQLQNTDCTGEYYGLYFGPYVGFGQTGGRNDAGDQTRTYGVRTWGARAVGKFNAYTSYGLYTQPWFSDGGVFCAYDTYGAYIADSDSLGTGGSVNIQTGLFLEAPTRGNTNYQVVLDGNNTASCGIWFNDLAGLHIGVDANTYLYVSNIPVSSTTTNPLYWDATNKTIHRPTSSRRFKDNINDYQCDWNKILEVKPKTFTGLGGGQYSLGYIAEEIDELGLDYLVNYDKEGQPESLNYMLFSIYAIEVIKDLSKRIEKLEKLCGKKTAQTKET